MWFLYSFFLIFKCIFNKYVILIWIWKSYVFWIHVSLIDLVRENSSNSIWKKTFVYALNLAKALLVIAWIAATFIHKVVTIARVVAEGCVKQVGFARKKAREALDCLTFLLVAKDRFKKPLCLSNTALQEHKVGVTWQDKWSLTITCPNSLKFGQIIWDDLEPFSFEKLYSFI